jgi:2-polyprenyl-3-methyl-5-hydroxy-6-metoxy-1,4-benzoquinol methylase
VLRPITAIPMQFTDQEFFDYEVEHGRTPDNPDYLALHAATADLIAKYKPRRVLEIGPGMGTILECLAKKGIYAAGIDSNRFHRDFFIKRNPALADRYGLLDHKFELHRFDFVVSIEVFEHMPDALIHEYMKPLKPRTFLFSSTPHKSTPEFDEQWGHINLKQESEWIDLFSEYGYQLKKKLTMPTHWTLLFKRPTGMFQRLFG